MEKSQVNEITTTSEDDSFDEQQISSFQSLRI